MRHGSKRRKSRRNARRSERRLQSESLIALPAVSRCGVAWCVARLSLPPSPLPPSLPPPLSLSLSLSLVQEIPGVEGACDMCALRLLCISGVYG